MRKCKGYWTHEKCKEEALKYKSKTEFQKLGKGAYNSSRNNNWFSEICSHMIINSNNIKSYGYWTYEKCKEEASKYSNLVSFRNDSISAHNASKKHGWYTELTSHMNRRHTKHLGYWTYEKCKEEAEKYVKRIDFKNSSPTAYAVSIKNNWDFLNYLPSRYYNYTKEVCVEEALRYKNRTEFRDNSGSIFRCSVKNNWIDDICSHMIKRGNRHLRCIYSAEFDDNYVYIGLTYNYEMRIKEHTHSKNIKKSAVYKHIEKIGKLPTFKKLTNYIDVHDASILEGKILESYISNGWDKLNRMKCGGIGAV